jgi:hypothetical protein
MHFSECIPLMNDYTCLTPVGQYTHNSLHEVYEVGLSLTDRQQGTIEARFKTRALGMLSKASQD